jgi:pilus assembly protein CpaE
MPNEVVATPTAPPRSEPTSNASLPRHDRAAAMSFVTDATTETALRDGLTDVLPEGLDSHRGGIGVAITALQKIASPQVLIVDITGEEQPLAALGNLSACVEPDTCVLVVGDVRDLTLYRDLTRGLGVAEYLPKPITRDVVGRHFAPLVRGQWPEAERQTGGRLITVTGARGGVGASVIAASLAWYFGTTARRHTMLLDADLHRGIAALLLDAEPGEGLRIALETPERIDALLAERVAHPVSDRLHVLSTIEPPTRDIHYAPDAADSLLAALCRRYNCVVADVPWLAEPFCRDLHRNSYYHVLVLTPTLPSIRDALRMLNQTGRESPKQFTVTVLNRAGMPGGLKRAQVQEALRVPIDIAIPDLPRQVTSAVTLGEPAAMRSSTFRSAIVELAKQVGPLRLVDTPATAASARTGRGGLLGSLWSRKAAAK